MNMKATKFYVQHSHCQPFNMSVKSGKDDFSENNHFFLISKEEEKKHKGGENNFTNNH